MNHPDRGTEAEHDHCGSTRPVIRDSALGRNAFYGANLTNVAKRGRDGAVAKHSFFGGSTAIVEHKNRSILHDSKRPTIESEIGPIFGICRLSLGHCGAFSHHHRAQAVT